MYYNIHYQKITFKNLNFMVLDFDILNSCIVLHKLYLNESISNSFLSSLSFYIDKFPMISKFFLPFSIFFMEGMSSTLYFRKNSLPNLHTEDISSLYCNPYYLKNINSNFLSNEFSCICKKYSFIFCPPISR